MKIYTSRSSVYEIGPNGEGSGFVAEKIEPPEEQITRVRAGRRFESATLYIDMKNGLMVVEGLVLHDITKIES